MNTKSLSDFKHAFSGIPNSTSKKTYSNILHATLIKTPLGDMLAVADQKHLCLIEFVDWRGLTREIERLRNNTNSVIFAGQTPPLVSIKLELKKYFKGELKRFKTPLLSVGTPFQKQVWAELKKIPYGQTRSYYDIAILCAKPTGFRAVANANGKNQFAVVIPCHRVINHNGKLGGYGGGLERKKWLIEHENNNL